MKAAHPTSSRRRRVWPWVNGACLSLVGLVFALPLAWMLVTSFQSETDALSPGLDLPIDRPAAIISQAHQNYRTVLTDESVNFPLLFRNTIIVVSLGVTGTVVSSTIVAYGLARVRLPARRAMLAMTVVAMLIPFPLLMVPQFILYAKLGWIGTFLPLFAPFWFGNAFSIFLMYLFFRSLPAELEEAAQLDGCSAWTCFTRVALPLSKPAIAVIALLHFTFMWNDFLAPLVFLVDRDMFTVALGLHFYQSRAGQTPWTLLMAASVLTMLPVLMIFVLALRTFLVSTSAFRHASPETRSTSPGRASTSHRTAGRGAH